MKRSVDLVHVFDSAGQSVLTVKFLERQIQDLEKRNELLEGAVRRLKGQLDAYEDYFGAVPDDDSDEDASDEA